MATKVREELWPWRGLPQEPSARLRRDLNPIAAILPGIAGMTDLTGGVLTVGSGIAVGSVLRAGRSIDTSPTNTGLTRAVSVAGYPFSLVFVGENDGTTSAVECIGSLATAADKTVRVYAFSGTYIAQHIGNTTNASATTAGVWTFGTLGHCVAVFHAQNDIRIYGRGVVARARAVSTTDVGSMPALTKVAFGVYDGGSKVNPFDGRTAFTAWFNTAFSEDFAWDVLENPGLVFEPQRIAVPFDLAAAATFQAAWARNSNVMIQRAL